MVKGAIGAALAVLAVLAAPVLAAPVLAAPVLADEIKVTGGTIRGLDRPDGSHLYFTIPYAAPPVGDLRWRPPAPVVPWSGVRDAATPGAPCVQADEGWNGADAAKGKEDCLYLSIHTPAHAAGDKLPVLFWIHGGSNRAGSGYGTAESPIYRKGIVVVAIEYRLGVFGFLSSPELTAESPHRASGNYALMDQVAALRWVHDNIAAFGGDPDEVTIAGQSAGAMDVSVLLRSPLARGLFRGAIQESGAMQPPRSAADNEKVGVAVMNALHVASLAQLRAAPATDLLKATATMLPPDGEDHSLLWMEASADGWVLTAPQNDLAHDGDQAPVPLLLGDNSREVPMDDGVKAVRGFIAKVFKAKAAQAETLYGIEGDRLPPPDPILGGAGTQVISDAVFRCPVYQEARWQVALGQPVWRYDFGVAQPGMNAVAHNAELAYVFGATPAGATFGAWPPVQAYWANFVKTGDPNGPGLPTWPRMTKEGETIAFLPSGPTVLSDYRGPQCRLMVSAQ
jgi:para-nitrobenzyl esterase